MNHHRLQSLLAAAETPDAVPAPGSFMVCPGALLPYVTFPWQGSIYQIAFEQAQAQARPSLLERALLIVLN